MHGHMVIADISGYTQFLTTSELDHANGIIGELLNAVIGSIQAPLEVSGIEGDAVFMYGVKPEDMQGQTVLESVELLYCSFASTLETMVLNTTCQCNACVNIKALGLKIVMHCGEFAVTEIGGRETVSGPDVILAHRLLKNTIKESTGIADYLLVTQQCVDDLGVEAAVAGWVPHTEEYEHVGEVAGYVSSLPDVWAFIRQQNEDKVIQRDAWLDLTAYSKAPPSFVWDMLTDPLKRRAWMDVNGVTTDGLVDGRLTPGSELHCAHGDENEVAVFSVLDIRPLEYITLLSVVQPNVALRWTDYVIPSGAGTKIVSYSAPLFSVDTGETVAQDVLDGAESFLGDGYRERIERMAAMADAAHDGAAAS
ncbi:MAG: DUF2652 domain-containing protein [Acidimicrobiia bacterium]